LSEVSEACALPNKEPITGKAGNSDE